jgi:hypothetical protein
VATYKVLDLKDLSTAEFYEILARSYRIQVRDEDLVDATLFHHPASWRIETIRRELPAAGAPADPLATVHTVDPGNSNDVALP